MLHSSHVTRPGLRSLVYSNAQAHSRATHGVQAMTYVAPALARGITRQNSPGCALAIPAARREFRVSRRTLTIADILRRIQESRA